MTDHQDDSRPIGTQISPLGFVIGHRVVHRARGPGAVGAADMSEMMVHWTCHPDAWMATDHVGSFRRRRWLRTAALFDRMLIMSARRVEARFRRRRP